MSEDKGHATSSGIKDKLMSFISRKKSYASKDYDDDIEYEEHEEADSGEKENLQGSFVDRLPFLSSILNKGRKPDKNSEEESDKLHGKAIVSKGKVQKRKIEIKLIHIIIVIGLVIFVLAPDEKKEESTVPNVVNSDVDKIKKSQPESSVSEIESVAKDPSTTEVDSTLTDPGTTEADSTLTDTSTTEADSALTDPSTTEVDSALTDPGTTEVELATTEASNTEMNSDMGQELKKQSVDDTVSDMDTLSSDSMTDITKKLLGDLEQRIKTEKKEQELVEVLKPVAAPSYEARGPSLVYNCTGQHWACVEPKAFIECRQNYSWNKKNSLPVECYPFADMSDNFDCATIQQEKVNNIGDTSFCK